MSCVRVLTRDTDVGFLSVRLSVRPSVQFRQKSAGKIGSLASCLSKSLRVIESYMHLSGTYDFLLVIHSNYGPTSYSCTISEINGHFCRKNFPPPLFYNGVLILKNYNAEKKFDDMYLVQPFRQNIIIGGTNGPTDRQKSHINIAGQHTDATRDKSAVLQSAPTAPRPIAQCVCVRVCV